MNDDQVIPKPKKSDILHEILHACFIVNTMFDEHVRAATSEHGDAETKALAEGVSDSLGDLYQLLGAKLHEAATEEEAK